MSAPCQGGRLSYQTQTILESVVFPASCIPQGTQADGLSGGYPHSSSLALTWLPATGANKPRVFNLTDSTFALGTVWQDIDDPSNYSDEASLEAYAGPDGQADGLRCRSV